MVYFMTFKNIVNDWQGQFPILSPYTASTLFAKADIILIGLRLDKDRFGGKEYRVYLQVLPLWVEKDKINIPFVDEELLRDATLQLLIDCRFHDPLLEDFVEGQKKWGVTDPDGSKFRREREWRLAKLGKAFKCAHQRFGTVLQEYVRLSDVLRLIDSARVRGIWSMCRILELKLALAYYFGNENLISQVKGNIEELVKDMENGDCKAFDNISAKEWQTDLYCRMEDREMFMRQVELNLNIKRISRLKPIHISDDVDLSQHSDTSANIPDYVELRNGLLRRFKHFFGFDK